jgi:DNA primase
MQDAKEEVRSRLNIEDVIGEYVQLKRAGRNFKGLSPFTSEKTPSFTVSPEKHIWHDFSSGKGGDIFSFVMEVEGLDFRQALEQLARKAGVELEQYDSKQSGDIAKRKKRLLEATALAARYFQQSLVRNTHALEYVFKTRGLSKEIVKEFGLGYAPDGGEALVAILKKKGFSSKELSDAGLVNRYGRDLFRGRMTVPLMDVSGQVIGFTGRILKDEPNAPKYLNTPQTLLYDKSRHVFGLSQAKEAIRKADRSVLVEGNLDVVSSHQAGVKNVVATAGTALTEWQLKSLSRLSPHVVLAFDGDKAGVAATERAIPIAVRVGVELSIATLPDEAKDPDELIRQDVSLWQKTLENTKPAVDWIIEQYLEREDLTTALGKRNFTTASLGVLKSLNDAVETEHYLSKIASLTNSSLEAVRTKFIQPQTAETVEVSRKKMTVSLNTDGPSFNTIEDNALAVLRVWPATRSLLADFDTSLFSGEARQRLAAYLKSHPKQFDSVPEKLKDIETYVRIVELKAETRYEAWSDAERTTEVARLLRHIITESKKRTRQTLLEELRDAEEVGDDALAERLRRELHQLIKETAHG